MKHRLIFRLFAAAALVVVVAVVLGFRGRGAEPIVQRIAIEIEAPADGLFLTEPMVRQLLTNQGITEGMPLTGVPLAAAERALEATGFVRQAVLSCDAQNQLNVAVALRVPIARVLTADGTSRYLARDGAWVPLSDLVAVRCVLVRGILRFQGDTLVVPREQTDALLQLLATIDADALLRAQVAEVLVDGAGGITLFPAVGDTELYLGRLTRVPEKLTALRAFYRQVAPRVGWDVYRHVDFSFAGQIVCRRRNLTQTIEATTPS